MTQLTVSVTCHQCGESRRVRDEAIGKRVRCPNCEAPILVKAEEVYEDFEYAEEESLQPPSGRRQRRGEGQFLSDTAGMPQQAKETIVALATAGLLWSVFGGMGLYLMQTDDLDSLGQVVTYCMLALGICGFLCAGLLWKKISAGKYLAMVISVFYLLFFPIGTIVAVIIYRGLFSPDLDRYLSSS